MVESYRIGIIGGGSMGGAIASGLVASGRFAADRVLITDHNPSKLEALHADSGVTTLPSAEELLAQDTEVLILAVKPQVMLKLVDEQGELLKERLVISIAAGIPLETYEDRLPASRIVRVMPNLPIKVRSGASAIAVGSRATADDVAVVEEMFSSLGVAKVMREDQLDVCGQDVGLSPAVFALVIDALTRAGIRKGMPAAACREMLESTMLGTAQILCESGEHPRAFMERITSPGGTTIAFLREAEPGIVAGCEAGIDAAMQRNAELAD